MPRDVHVHVQHACVVSIIKLLHTQSALSATEGVNKKFTFRFRSMVVLRSFYGTNRSVFTEFPIFAEVRLLIQQLLAFARNR